MKSPKIFSSAGPVKGVRVLRVAVPSSPRIIRCSASGFGFCAYLESISRAPWEGCFHGVEDLLREDFSWIGRVYGLPIRAAEYPRYSAHKRQHGPQENNQSVGWEGFPVWKVWSIKHFYSGDFLCFLHPCQLVFLRQRLEHGFLHFRSSIQVRVGDPKQG